MEELGDKRLYTKRLVGGGGGRRERQHECERACVLYYNTQLWTQFCVSGRTWEQRWLRSVCASSQSDQTLPSFAYHLRWMYIPKTCTGLQKIQKKKKKNTQQLHVAGYYNAEISLHKAIVYLSVSNFYTASNKNTISGTRLNLSLFQNLCIHSLMNVLLNFYHVTAIPSLNHSLLDV